MTWVVAARCDVQKCDQNATINAGGELVRHVVRLTLLRYSTRYYSYSRTSTQACQLHTLPCFDLEGKCCGMGSINEINRKIRT